jgi:hypothetical protein
MPNRRLIIEAGRRARAEQDALERQMQLVEGRRPESKQCG